MLEFLAKSPGSTHYVGDLANGFEVTEQQIRSCINSIIRDEALPGLEVVIPQRSWVYRPSAEPKHSNTKRVFEEIGQTRSGDLILQDQDGKVYRAKELE